MRLVGVTPGSTVGGGVSYPIEGAGIRVSMYTSESRRDFCQVRIKLVERALTVSIAASVQVGRGSSP